MTRQIYIKIKWIKKKKDGFTIKPAEWQDRSLSCPQDLGEGLRPGQSLAICVNGLAITSIEKIF